MPASVPHDTVQLDKYSSQHVDPPLIERRESSSDGGEAIVYVHGLRFWLLAVAISVMLFLASLDTTITTTSLVAITHDLGGFQTASWILSGYQLGWVAVIVICAKLSDIFGRKPVFIVCITLFAVFSAGCAAAQTMAQLIILRAFQGVGGGGCLALTTILITEAVPPEELGSFASKVNVALIMSLVLGPVLGGAITSGTTWRWIFIINIPMSLIAVVLAQVGIPSGFPHHGHPKAGVATSSSKVTKLARLDIVGSVLLILAALSFTSGFQEADSRFAWNSAYVITLLIVSLVLWVALLLWERHVTLFSRVREPVMPWRFFTDRVRAGVMLVFVLAGVPIVVTNFQLPQRFQLVNGLSSIDASVRILPFGVAFCVGSLASSRLTSSLRVPSIYHVLAGAALQVVGFALLGVLRASPEIQPAVYGYQVLCGIGVGLNYMALYLLIPFTADRRDKAIGMGLAAQFRTMGSAFGLAIVTSVFNGYTGPRLTSLGLSTEVTSIMGLGTQRLAAITPELLADVRYILSEAYNRQMLVLCAFAAAQIPAALLMWKRKQIVAA
ncbi:hypothetical protein XA68_14500 [Ophiocordyceps unilateralis]|uniref:Major facilitator superfamily (MFS) profile domain-containing protein n=1 Tax=Ophiocordyceps unilateralis TaxID=268505 RepID=A0A2A9PME3_OPHUN|nr:hypothetical protein XA68_14500 [Ophiocordyceps unilateralis]